jgi:SAM-dependent methyltransferase
VSIERGWLDRFCELLTPGASVLDVGCGHGDPIGRHLLAAGFEITGVDRAPSLIAMAKARLPAGHWCVDDMRTMGLGLRFDGMIVWHSLFHLHADEQRDVFPLLREHAGPTAVLMFTTGPAAGSRLGAFGGETLRHESLAPAEYIALLDAAEFDVIDHQERDQDCGDATVWLARSRVRR